MQDNKAAKHTPNVGSLPHSKGSTKLVMDTGSNSVTDEMAVTPGRNRRMLNSDDEADRGRETPGMRYHGTTLSPQVQ